LRRILGAMRPDILLDWHDNAWLAAKGLDTLEAIERAAALATPAPLDCDCPEEGHYFDCRLVATPLDVACPYCGARHSVSDANFIKTGRVTRAEKKGMTNG
jgi:hypothetical protein